MILSYLAAESNPQGRMKSTGMGRLKFYADLAWRPLLNRRRLSK
jgi:hypothetical protein